MKRQKHASLSNSGRPHRGQLRKLLVCLILQAWLGLSALSPLSAQTLQVPPPVGPTPLWTGSGTDGGLPSPESACQSQHDYYNPGATLRPPTYNGGIWASCNWDLNANSNTVLPALVKAYCPPGWGITDVPSCIREGNPDTRPQCNCVGAPPTGTPQPTIGNPVALNFGAKVENETDYTSADGRFSVERDYYSLPADTNVISPTTIAGFGERWHGLIPGKLVVYDGVGRAAQYLDTKGGYATFDSDAVGDAYNWSWHSSPATRIRLYGVNYTSSNKSNFFFQDSPVTNGPAELRMEMFSGEYILFRRIGAPSNVRTLIPIERGFPDGYKINYIYTDASEFPTQVSDSLGRQMNLTWAAAERRLSYLGLATVRPIKVISDISLPDGTNLHYNYGFGTDLRGSQVQDRLEGVQRLSSSGTQLWARSYLYENPNLSFYITGKVDQNGDRLSTYAYDPAGMVSSTELAGGFQKYQITNLEESNLAYFWRQVTNPLGHRTDYTFFRLKQTASSQRVLSKIKEYADTGVAEATRTYNYYGYIGDMVIANATDEKGRTVHNDPDGNILPSQTIEASGTPLARLTKFTWHPTFDVPTHEEKAGVDTDYSYSPTGLLLSKTLTDTSSQTVPYSTAGQTRTWTYNWNGNGRLLSINGPKGPDLNGKDDITSFEYDANGNLLTSTNALGHVTTFANYDANGRPGSMIDPNGVNSLFGYDALGRLTTLTVKNPELATDAAVTTIDYDAEGRVIGVTAPATQKISIDRDLAGQVIAISSPSGEKIAFTHDAMGNVTNEAVKRTNGTIARQTARTFDGLGRMLTETLGANRTTQYAYDAVGNATTVTSARSNATIQAFDQLDRLVSTVAPDTGNGQSGYDAHDRRISFTDPISVQTKYVRNGFGDIISEVSPDRGTSTYYYDGAGEVIASVDGRGQRVDIVRDALGRVISKTPLGQLASSAITYGYDAPVAGKGRLSSITDATGVTLFAYDYRGNLRAKAKQSGLQVTAKLSYTYDKADRVLSIRYPSGRIVNYLRDTQGRVTSVTTAANATDSPVTLVSGITYEAFGSLISANFGNGLTLGNNLGNDGRLVKKRLYRATDGSNLLRLTYEYDNDDNITAITDAVDPTRSITYSYDSVGRLAQSVLSSGTVRRQDFAYDLNGNRTHVDLRSAPTDPVPLSTATYARNAGTNQLASVMDSSGTRSIAYDGRGNTASEVRPDASVAVQYDGYGRLTSYQKTGQSTLINAYNGLDERVSAGPANDLRSYVFDADGRMMGEYGSSTSDVKAETIWLSPQVNTPNQPFGGGDGVDGYAPLAVVTGGVVYWVHGNHLGVPTVITDGTGTVAAPAGYTPVGFPGQTRTLADLYYNRYRDYDPTIGRYIQADPIGLEGDTNVYAYAENNPIRYMDPAGLKTLWEHYTGLPDSYRTNIMNGMAGWSDTFTFGLTHALRELLDANRDIDLCNPYYAGGAVAGLISPRGAARTVTRWFRYGKEFRFGRVRVAPFGNRNPNWTVPPHRIGRFPHYHRDRGPAPTYKPRDKNHRPWEGGW